MSASELLRLAVSAGLGGLVGFVWSQTLFGNRLTRIETKIEAIERTLHNA